jgi:hypothetical protein
MLLTLLLVPLAGLLTPTQQMAEAQNNDLHERVNTNLARVLNTTAHDGPPLTVPAQIMHDSVQAQATELAEMLKRRDSDEAINDKIWAIHRWLYQPEIRKDFQNATDLKLQLLLRTEMDAFTEALQLQKKLTPEEIENALTRRRLDRASARDLLKVLGSGETIDSKVKETILKKKPFLDVETDQSRPVMVRLELAQQLFSHAASMFRHQWLFIGTYEAMSSAINQALEVLYQTMAPELVNIAIDETLVKILMDAFFQIPAEQLGPESMRLIVNLSSGVDRHPFIQLQASAILKNARIVQGSTPPTAKDIELYKKSLHRFIFEPAKGSASPQEVPHHHVAESYLRDEIHLPLSYELAAIEVWLSHHGIEVADWARRLGTTREGIAVYRDLKLPKKTPLCMVLLSTTTH